MFPEYKSARFRPAGGAGAPGAQSVRGGGGVAAASHAGIGGFKTTQSPTVCATA